MTVPLIDIAGLEVGFTGRDGATLPILRGVDLRLEPGETLGLVGESGSGKSTLALAALGHLRQGLRVLAGQVRFRGQDVFALPPHRLSALRGGSLALIPQNAGQALTPTMRVGAQVAEALRLHATCAPADIPGRVVQLLARVRLPTPEAIARRFPHELSGGQQQRVAIAMALAGEPAALLLDEPTTGLDVTTQAHILELLRALAAESGTAMLYVSHDLGAVARVCDRIAVMYAGEVVQEGPATHLLRTPRHPYARALLAAIPRIAEARIPAALEGRPPMPGATGPGCAFAPRCTLAAPVCQTHRPAPAATEDGTVRCHRASETAQPLPEAQPLAATAPGEAVLSVQDLAVSYARPGPLAQLLGRPAGGVPQVADIRLEVHAGETLALVGESGSGKSSILKAIAGLLPPAAGRISLPSGPLAAAVDHRRPDEVRRIQLVFQNPDESLNPRHTIADILAQPLRLYHRLAGPALRVRAAALLEEVRLGAHHLDRLPAQLSGGEKQRVAIARALAAEPALLLCDEPTSALDVSVQAAVLALLARLRRERGIAILFVAHDLAVVRAIADRVAVLYQGRLCEIGPAEAVYRRAAHPYTEALLGAVLEPEPGWQPRLLGHDMVERGPPARGCPFQNRCHRHLGPICNEQAPPAHELPGGHVVHCHIPPA
jgi:peptide/nickel transport system ATP-binding protein